MATYPPISPALNISGPAYAQAVHDAFADVWDTFGDLGSLATLSYPGGTSLFLRSDGTWASPPGGGGGGGDMFKATYDTDNDGVVDAAESVPWTGLTAMPAAIGAINGLTPAADRLAYYTGSGTAALATFTSFARTFVAYADAASAFGGIKQAATATSTGVVELATDAETITGTDTSRAVTPANVAAKTIKDWISILIEAPANQDYVIARNLPVGCTVNSITTKSASGTCTLTGKINTTALGGTANSVSSTETTQTHSSANVAAAGDDLVLTVSANATCLRLEATVAITRALGT